MALESMKNILGMLIQNKLQQQSPSYQIQLAQLNELQAAMQRRAQINALAKQREFTPEQLSIAGAYAEGGQFAAAVAKQKWARAKRTAKEIGIDPETAYGFQEELDKSSAEFAQTVAQAPTRREMAAEDILRGTAAKADATEQAATKYFDSQLGREIKSQKEQQNARMPYDEFLASLRAKYATDSGGGGGATFTSLATGWAGFVKNGKFYNAETGEPANAQEMPQIQDYYFKNNGMVKPGFSYEKSYKPYREYEGRVINKDQDLAIYDSAVKYLDADVNFEAIPKRFRVTGGLFGLDNDEEATVDAIVDAAINGDPLEDVPATMREYAFMLASYRQNTRTKGKEKENTGNQTQNQTQNQTSSDRPLIEADSTGGVKINF